MILHNPSDKDITNYRISEQTLDANGNSILNNDGTPVMTGRTLEWSLKAGETFEFPDYVGKYLKEIYGFLEVTEPVKVDMGDMSGTSPSSSITPPAKPNTSSVACKWCGQYFNSLKGLGLHFAHSHPEKLI